MFLNYKILIYFLSPLLFSVSCKLIDKKIDNDFSVLVVEAKKTVEKNLANEERASLNLNSKIRYIALNTNLVYIPYIEYKLRYCYSYVLKEGSPEKTFLYYKWDNL